MKRKPRILLGWEFGSGFGHVAMLLPIARALRSRGAEPVLALLNPRAAAHALTPGEDLRVIQAPLWPMPKNPDREAPTHTLADVLALCGYHEEAKLTPHALAWQALIEAVKPDAVIAEYAPTLALAALSHLPVMTVGTGYTVPLSGRRLTNIRFWQPEMSAASVLAENRLLKSVNAARAALGLLPLAFFSDLFGGQCVRVCTFPELDNARAFREGAAIGPIGPMPSGNAAKREGVFAYMSAQGRHLEALAAALAATGGEGYIRGLSPQKLQEFRTLGARLHGGPQDLRALLPRLSGILHFGGHATACEALLSGTPQLIVSQQLEQQVTGEALRRQGVAISLSSRQAASAETIAAALSALQMQAGYREKAEETMERLAAWRSSRPKPEERIAEECLGLLQETTA